MYATRAALLSCSSVYSDLGFRIDTNGMFTKPAPSPKRFSREPCANPNAWARRQSNGNATSGATCESCGALVWIPSRLRPSARSTGGPIAGGTLMEAQEAFANQVADD